MICAAIMTPSPLSVRDDETLGEAAERILALNCIDLPVVDSDGRLVGLFGVYDLLALLVPRIAMVGDLIPNLRFMGDAMTALNEKYAGLRDVPVRRAANREPATVFPDTPVIEAVRLFCRSNMTIPVVERETRLLAGTISYWDAARAIMATAQ